MKLVKKGEIISLVILEQSEASLAAALEARNADHFAAYDVTDPILSQTSFWVNELLMNEKNIQEGKSFFFHVVETESAMQVPIGFVYISGIRRGQRQTASLSFGVDAVYQGRGMMKEALSLAIDYAFNVLKLHKIYAQYHIQNERSKILLERLGFIYEGRLLQELLIRNQWEDLIQVAIFNKMRIPC